MSSAYDSERVKELNRFHGTEEFDQISDPFQSRVGRGCGGWGDEWKVAKFGKLKRLRCRITPRRVLLRFQFAASFFIHFYLYL